MTMRSHLLRAMVLTFGVLLLSACAETELVSHWAKRAMWPGQQESKGTYKVGNPYRVGNIWYHPHENFNLVETGIASWYGPGFHQDRTANGEIFDQHDLTAAHPTLQLPCLTRVTNLENGRSVVVRVNDRGPFKSGRVMDVSMRAAELLGFANKGTARVRIEVLEKESRILAAAAKRGEDTTRITLADLRSRGGGEASPVPVPSSGPDSDIPESLRTPTITVEELAAARARTGAAPLVSTPSGMAAGDVEGGRFMPAAVVSKVPVHPTSLFVQAGSFSVYGNAERLAGRLIDIAPTVIDPVTVGRRKLYRVRLGPIVSLAEADRVLAKVVQAGTNGAKVVKK